MTIHDPFTEEVKIDGVSLSQLMPSEDVFASLEKLLRTME